MTTITWTVEVDADPDTTGEFVIGSSLLGGSDVLSADERWVDVGPVVRQISIRRGRRDESRFYSTGVCTVELENVTEDFDTDNPYGHYVMGPEKLLHPGTGLRTIATVGGGGSSTTFAGILDKPKVIEDEFFPVAIFSCVDWMAALGTTDVPDLGFVQGAGESSSARANWLLDLADVPTAQRNVAASGRNVLGTTGGEKVRVGLERVAAGEGGRFYVDRTGDVTLTWHDAEYGKTADLLFTNIGTSFTEYAAIETSPGVEGVINTATVHRVAPRLRNEETGQFVDSAVIPDVGAVDSGSVALYGARPVAVETVLESDSDAESLANYLAVRRSVPTSRVTKLRLPPLEQLSVGDAEFVLLLDIGSAVAVRRRTLTGRDQTWLAIVEGIEIDARPTRTDVTLMTAPADTASVFGSAGWFIIGTSLLGGADVLAPF